jgi:uncharacterized protein YbaR (Trm112 family)
MEPKAHEPVDDLLLSLLACPESHQPLSWASADLLAKLNRRISEGGVRRHDGTPIHAPLEAGLLRADGHCLYPVEEGIPNLLVGDRIDLAEDRSA